MRREPELRITLAERRRDGGLRLDYTFTNAGHSPLYVFTRVADNRLRPRPHQAYTAWRERPEALHLFLGVPPIPKGLHVYVKVVPFASYLPPGKSYSYYLELPLPVPEWQPYADPEQAEDVESVVTRSVLVSTEYFREDQLLRPPTPAGPAGYFKALGAPLVRTGAYLTLAEPVTVLKRRDEFERF